MKAIIILYKGNQLSAELVARTLVYDVGLKSDKVAVKVLSDSDVESLTESVSTMSSIFDVDSSVTTSSADFADDAADVIIRVSQGTDHDVLAKRIIPLICKNRYDADDTTDELVKAINVLSSGKKVSNDWLKRHGLTRTQWNKAQQFIGELSSVELYG